MLEVAGRPAAPTDPDPPGFLRVRVGRETVRVSLADAIKKLRPDVARVVGPMVIDRLTASERLALAHDALSRVGTVEAVEQLSDGMLKVTYATHEATSGRAVSRTITIAARKFLPAFSPPVGASSSLVGRTFVIAKPAPKAAS